MVTTRRAGTWRTRLTASEIALCESVAGGLLREHGYEVEGTVRPERGDLVRYRRDGTIAYKLVGPVTPDNIDTVLKTEIDKALGAGS